MATHSCHWLILVKVEIGIYCYLTEDFLTKVLQKYSWSSPLPNIRILSKPLNLIGCHSNQKAKVVKIHETIISSEAIRGMKLKLCRNVHNICLYKSLLPLLMCFCCYGNLKLKNHLLRSHKVDWSWNFAEMFSTFVCTKSYVFIAVVHVLSLLWQLKSFHWLIMGKVKVGLYFCLTLDILTKNLQKCSLSSPLRNPSFLSKRLNLIGCHGNWKAKFAKKY